ncbi:MAG: SPOR domain-containing protein [Pseudomonadota bacterium]
MAAKKSSSAGSRSKSGGSSTARVLFIGVIVGFILGFASHWWFADTFSNAKELVAHAKSVGGDKEEPAAKPAPKADKKAADSKYKPLKVDPQTEAEWSFHELLEEKVDSTPSAAKTNGSTTGKNYVMGCAAFSAQEKAESMKAQIAFAGLQADVKPVTSKTGARLFRVQLGPYSSKAAAEADKKKLADAGVSTCQIW